jgi:hypothetical protein
MSKDRGITALLVVAIAIGATSRQKSAPQPFTESATRPPAAATHSPISHSTPRQVGIRVRARPFLDAPSEFESSTMRNRNG